MASSQQFSTLTATNRSVYALTRKSWAISDYHVGTPPKCGNYNKFARLFNWGVETLYQYVEYKKPFTHYEG